MNAAHSAAYRRLPPSAPNPRRDGLERRDELRPSRREAAVS